MEVNITRRKFLEFCILNPSMLSDAKEVIEILEYGTNPNAVAKFTINDNPEIFRVSR